MTARFDQSEDGEWITVRVGDAIDVVTLDVYPLRDEVAEYAGQHGVVAGFALLPANIDGTVHGVIDSTVYGVMVELENGHPPVMFVPYELMLPKPALPPVNIGVECARCEQDQHDACSGSETQPCTCDTFGHPNHDSEGDLL